MKERLKAILPKIGFPLFYLLCLVVFARWTFPWEKLRDRVVATVNDQARESGEPREIKIDELGPSSLAGISAKGVHLFGPPTEPGKPPSEITIDAVRASVSLFGLLFGNHDLSFGVEGFGGTIDGSFEDSTKERKIDATFDSINLSQVQPISDALGVPVDGTFGGSIKITMPEGKSSKATGAVSIEAKDLAVGDGKAKLKGFLALPRLTIGTLTVTGDAKDGVLKISKLGASGKDLELQGDGRVLIKDSLGESLADMNLRFKISDAYRSKNDTTKNLFGAPGTTVPGIIDMDPHVKQSKRSDGFYGWHMKGQLARPEFDPAPMAGPTPGMAPMSPATPGATPPTTRGVIP